MKRKKYPETISSSLESYNTSNKMTAPFYKILSEESLEKLICSICNNYLSCGKIKIGNNKLICGRCNQEEGILTHDQDLSNYLFPCINRFNDCKELLQYTDVKEHEKICKKNIKHSCFKCEYSGNRCQLYHHCLKEHPDHILQCSVFNIYLWRNKNWKYLYRINSNLFLITYQISKPEHILKLSMQCVGNISETLKCQIILKSTISNENYFISEYKNILNEEINILAQLQKYRQLIVTCHLNVKIVGELFTLRTSTIQMESQQQFRESAPGSSQGDQQQVSDDQLKLVMKALNRNLFPKLVCFNCGCYVIPPIYICPLNHVKCEDCNSSFCSACKDIVNWSRATDLEVFHNIVPLPCRWNCRSMLLTSELRTHEKNCHHRKYKCVKQYCTWKGSINDLIKHWHSSIPIYKDAHEIYGFDEDLVEFYLIYNCEIFYWRLNPLKRNGRFIHTRKISTVSPLGQIYSAKVLLTHNCEETLRQKARNIPVGGITLLNRRYFDYFGHCKKYKIIFTMSLIS
jgi:hypothetical protein